MSGAVSGRALNERHPLGLAQVMLLSRLERADRGLFLDGRLVSAREVIIAANEVAALSGQPAIAYPGVDVPRIDKARIDKTGRGRG